MTDRENGSTAALMLSYILRGEAETRRSEKATVCRRLALDDLERA